MPLMPSHELNDFTYRSVEGVSKSSSYIVSLVFERILCQ